MIIEHLIGKITILNHGDVPDLGTALHLLVSR